MLHCQCGTRMIINIFFHLLSLYICTFHLRSRGALTAFALDLLGLFRLCRLILDAPHALCLNFWIHCRLFLYPLTFVSFGKEIRVVSTFVCAGIIRCVHSIHRACHILAHNGFCYTRRFSARNPKKAAKQRRWQRRRGSIKRTNNHKQWSLILLYRLIHSENSLGKSLAVARIIIFSAVIRKCVCALYLRFVTCLFTMQDMKLVDLARFLCVLVSASRRFNAANDCDNTQNSQLLWYLLLGVAVQTTRH